MKCTTFTNTNAASPISDRGKISLQTQCSSSHSTNSVSGMKVTVANKTDKILQLMRNVFITQMITTLSDKCRSLYLRCKVDLQHRDLAVQSSRDQTSVQCSACDQ